MNPPTWTTLVIGLTLAFLAIALFVLFLASQAYQSHVDQTIEYQTEAAVQRERLAWANQQELARQLHRDEQTEWLNETTDPHAEPWLPDEQWVDPPTPPLWQPARFHDGDTDPLGEDSWETDKTEVIPGARGRDPIEVWAEAVVVEDTGPGYSAEGKHRRPLPVRRRS